MNTLSSGSGGAPGAHDTNSPGSNANVVTSDSAGNGGAGSNNNNNNNGGGGSGGGNGGPSGSAIKKRRKSDTKPLSQINKCINEKRRREQVHNY